MRLTYLRPLYAEPGPWTSVYLDSSRDDANADHAVDLRWRAARGRLTDRSDADGPPPDDATLDEIGTAIAADVGVPGPHGLAVFAAGGRVRRTEILADPPPTDMAVHGPLPHAMPLVVARGEEIPWVRVLADRTGGDVDALGAGGLHRHAAVTGSVEWPLRKVHAGGWSDRRYDQAVEETWSRNAADVAQAATALADRIGAEVIIVAGDVRATTHVVDRLPKRWHDRVVRTEAGSRAEGADPRALDEVTGRLVGELVAERTRGVIDRYGAQRGDDTAPRGLAATVAALQRGQLDTLLLVNEPSSTDELWIGPDPLHLSVDPAQLRQMGVAEPVRVRADAALLRALCHTDAELMLVDGNEVGLEHGVGAVLRYSDASTRTR